MFSCPADCSRAPRIQRDTPVASKFARFGICLATAFFSSAALADQNGVSFWLPGQFGSFAAAPQVPGWQFATINYFTSVKASGAIAAAKEVSIGPFNPTLKVNVNVDMKAQANLQFLSASYVFPTSVLGGQFALGMATAAGYNHTSVDGTLTATVGPLGTTRTGSIGDSRMGFADLYPMATLRWNAGVHNFMVYGTGDIPTGTYDPTRLSNFGIGHAAIDGGVGYTYLNPQTGYELSVVTGMTYNYENHDTNNYRNGNDWHLDWGASKFLTKQWQVGAVGYVYDQITADHNAPPFLGDNKSRVAAAGPQIGYLFPIGSMHGYLNLKGYYEFDASRRADGFNTWLTFAITPSAEPPAAAERLAHR